MALARMLSNSGHDVMVWSAIEQEVIELAKIRKHNKLPDMCISQEISFTKEMKNILLFAVPSVLVYGDNAKAALMTCGMAEIFRLGKKMGCLEQTFSGLGGIGDLIVTATSVHSRNNNCGKYIGQGIPVKEAINRDGMVVEGINAISVAIKLGQRYGVELPIITAVHQVVEGANPLEIVKSLMRRDD